MGRSETNSGQPSRNSFTTHQWRLLDKGARNLLLVASQDRSTRSRRSGARSSSSLTASRRWPGCTRWQRVIRVVPQAAKLLEDAPRISCPTCFPRAPEEVALHELARAPARRSSDARTCRDHPQSRLARRMWRRFVKSKTTSGRLRAATRALIDRRSSVPERNARFEHEGRGRETTSTARDQATPMPVSNRPARKFRITPRMPAYRARSFRRDAASK
jgi:hypothetical protein